MSTASSPWTHAEALQIVPDWCPRWDREHDPHMPGDPTGDDVQWTRDQCPGIKMPRWLNNSWSAPVPPHPAGLALASCAHVGCVLPAGHDPATTCHTARTDGTGGWRFFPPPGLMETACTAAPWCIRDPHDGDEWHMHSTRSGTGPHNVWSTE